MLHKQLSALTSAENKFPCKQSTPETEKDKPLTALYPLPKKELYPVTYEDWRIICL